MCSRPKVCIISPCNFEDFPIGGTLTLIQNLLKYMQCEKMLVGLSTSSKAEVGRWSRQTIEDKIYPFLSLFRLNKTKQIIPIRLKFCLYLMFSNKKVKSSGADVLYAHTPDAAFPFLLFGRSLPIIVHLHGSSNPLIHSRYSWARLRFFQRIYSKLLKFVINRADRVIAVDGETFNFCRGLNLCEEKLTLIPNCVDRDLFKPLDRQKLRQQRGFGNSDKVVLYVGRLGKAKGLELLIESFALLRNEVPNSKLVLAGDGEEKTYLKKKSRQLQIAEHVEFIGQTEHKTLPGLINCADVYVLTSKCEGLPLALLEAMSCGVPVVSANVGGIAEVIKDGVNGFLFDVRDAKHVMNRILEGLNCSRQIRKNALVTIQGYLAETASQKITDVVNDVRRKKHKCETVAKT